MNWLLLILKFIVKAIRARVQSLSLPSLITIMKVVRRLPTIRDQISTDRREIWNGQFAAFINIKGRVRTSVSHLTTIQLSPIFSCLKMLRNGMRDGLIKK